MLGRPRLGCAGCHDTGTPASCGSDLIAGVHVVNRLRSILPPHGARVRDPWHPMLGLRLGCEGCHDTGTPASCGSDVIARLDVVNRLRSILPPHGARVRDPWHRMLGRPRLGCAGCHDTGTPASCGSDLIAR
jgi:hypothetical protein